MRAYSELYTWFTKIFFRINIFEQCSRVPLNHVRDNTLIFQMLHAPTWVSTVFGFAFQM